MRATPLLTRQLPTSLHTDTFHSMHGSLCRVKPPQRLSDRTGATRPMHACICVQDVPCMHKHDLRDVTLPCQQTISAPPQNCRVVKHAQNSTMMYVHWRRNAAPALLPWPSDRGACCQLLCSSQLSSQALGLSTALNLWEACTAGVKQRQEQRHQQGTCGGVATATDGVAQKPPSCLRKILCLQACVADIHIHSEYPKSG